MSIKSLYALHIAKRQETTEKVLEKSDFSALVIGSGKTNYYFADDRSVSFVSTPHFRHWLPTEGPHHLLVIEPNKRPKLIYHHPADFWHEQVSVPNDFWTDSFDIVVVEEEEKAWEQIKGLKNAAFIGPCEEAAQKYGLTPNPAHLVPRLDWERASKSEYEVHCLDLANELAAKGHKAVHQAFLQGASERELHFLYLKSLNAIDEEMPYRTIIALDEKAAVLHYQMKRNQGNGKVLLIDAGALINGYASDITRTYCTPAAHPVFKQLLVGMEKLQLELASMVRPGLPYGEHHSTCLLKIASLLIETGILKGINAADAVEAGLSRAFMPHGLGHLLGLQVHDVGGHLMNPDGTLAKPPEGDKYLRNMRILQDTHVTTIEPGLYFIPMLLDQQKQLAHSDKFNWKLIEELIPCGGIRIEDNIVCRPGQETNITRKYLP
jgi:Xaa-Pro dipeptidase